MRRTFPRDETVEDALVALHVAPRLEAARAARRDLQRDGHYWAAAEDGTYHCARCRAWARDPMLVRLTCDQCLMLITWQLEASWARA